MPNPYEDDLLVSDSGGAPVVSPLVQQSGIGLGSTDIAADRKAFEDSRSTIGRIALPFQEMRAARQGRKSEFQQMQDEKQKGRQRQLEEIKVFTDVVNHTFEKAEGMQGEARDKYIGLQGKVLDALSPGSSEFLKSLAADPEYAAILRKNADKSPTLRTALEVGGLKKAMTLFNSVEGARLIRGEIEGAEFPAIRTRLQTLGMAAKDLMTPDRYQQMMDDGFISPVEAAELNDAAKVHPKYKAAALSDEQLSLAARNEDATYGMAGFATSKTAQEKMGKPRESRKVRRGDKEITQEFKGGKWVDAETGNAFKGNDSEISPSKIIDIELKLSDDYRQDTKKFAERRPLFDSATDYMANRTEQKTSSGDAALMFAYAKMRDPNDRLAVSETRDLVKLGNIFERFGVSVVGILEKGETLPDRVASDMYKEIRRSFTEQNRQQTKIETDYRKKTTDYKANPDRVVRALAIPEDQLKGRTGDSQRSGGDIQSQADLEFTARKHGITVEEVKRRLKERK